MVASLTGLAWRAVVGQLGKLDQLRLVGSAADRARRRPSITSPTFAQIFDHYCNPPVIERRRVGPRATTITSKLFRRIVTDRWLLASFHARAQQRFRLSGMLDTRLDLKQVDIVFAKHAGANPKMSEQQFIEVGVVHTHTHAQAKALALARSLSRANSSSGDWLAVTVQVCGQQGDLASGCTYALQCARRRVTWPLRVFRPALRCRVPSRSTSCRWPSAATSALWHSSLSRALRCYQPRCIDVEQPDG